ncbi:MAG: cell division protein FtsA [Candidatus Puniceispirillales bacterium]
MTREHRKPVLRKPSKQRSKVIAGLDIGSNKVACFIAQNDGQAGPVVTGSGQYASAGMRSGEVIDLESLRDAVAEAVAAAERMAGLEIERLAVSISGGNQKSIMQKDEISLPEGRVGERDIARLLRKAMERDAEDGRSVLHRLPLQYTLDGVRGIRDPFGMQGQKLGVDMAVITAATSTLENLKTVVEMNHLQVECFVASAYASGLTALVEDEKDLGATIIEMGAGVTSIAIFMEGHLVYVNSVPFGGAHVTSDIARIVSTPMEEAERIKTLHGSVLTAIGDSDKLITLPQIGDDSNQNPQQIDIGLLGEIIRPRIEEIFELLLKPLERSGFSAAAGQRVVLTGGAAQITGIEDYLNTLFGRTVRIGKPMGMAGMADPTRGPAFTTTAGLLRYASVEFEREPKPEAALPRKTGVLGRIGEWFNEHI